MSSNEPPFDGPPLLSEIIGDAPRPAAPADPLVGTTLAGRYHISSLIGDGGMGSVYLAEHAILGKEVAIKLLKPELVEDPSLVERFFREARATASIQHENVVEILDYGQTPEYAFFVMEALSGCELADLIGRGRRMSWTRSKAILVQVVRALAAAHALGIVHRDMKPGNVFLIRRGDTPDFVKVLDFGIAKINDGLQLTRVGMVFGTAWYMAPEQATGGEIDGRTDIYSLGCVLFEMLTGRVPFPGDNFLHVLAKHVREPTPRLRDVVPELDIPPGVEELVARMLAKFASERFANMSELEQALLAIPEHHDGDDFPISSPPLASEPTAPTAMLRSIAPSGLEPARLGTLAYLYVAFAHGTDGVLTSEEMRSLAECLRAWAPQIELDQIGEILRKAVSNYGRGSNKSAELRDCRTALAAWFSSDQHAQVIADLREIASADGRFEAAELQFIDETAQAFKLDIQPHPMLRSLAFIYLALAHAADGAIDGQEMRVIGELLRQWAPAASLAEIAELLRDAVAEYKRLTSLEARLDRARLAVDELEQSCPRDSLRRVLADLWRLAGSDGHISPEEQRFIMEIVARFSKP